MVEKIRAGLVQMCSGPSIAENTAQADDLVRRAAGEGARFIATPENTCHIRVPQSEKLTSAPEEAAHPMIPHFAALAAELSVWLMLGSISIKTPQGRIANRCYVFSDRGAVAATYDKIHLFDVDLPTGESHRESSVVVPGDAACVVRTPFATVGLAICYDLRFPHLFRQLAQAGASVLTVPAAFTVPTGQAHWHTLLRARAIETGAYVLAPAQIGEHAQGRRTYGHSLIIGPWGDVIADAGEEVGVITADLDLAEVEKARQSIPALRHDRDFTLSSY